MYGQLLSVQASTKCHDVCPRVYRVVCAQHDGCFRTFANICVMEMYNCKYQKAYQIVSEKACEIISNKELQKLEL
ncbi:U-Kazal-Dg21.2 [Drosophila grimshawi]|uniref:GH17494 n=1 Tax=Drosophila grimshawi TaxID=7222 RepID=B4JTV8_DROGR|nr:U-Kazal-Dg21.2 [Drosophila grimshawi]EDV91537.1 GH17494 [Drosophila grimshawi]